jgi:hypothetical protein
MLLGLPSSRTASLSNIPLCVSSPVMALVMFTSYCFVFSSLQTLCLIASLFWRPMLCFHHLTDSFRKKYRGWGIPKPPSGSAFTRIHFASVNFERASMSRLFKVFVVVPPICYAVPAKRSDTQARKFLLTPEVLSCTVPDQRHVAPSCL